MWFDPFTLLQSTPPATLATPATNGLSQASEVAKVARVASPGEARDEIASDWWLICYPGREPVQVVCTPATTRAQMEERHPEAVTVEPFTPGTRRPASAMTAEEVAALKAWLVLIEETDPAAVSKVIERCQRDADARAYFIGLAVLSSHDALADDRRTCDQCANLIGRRCQAARRGEIVASRDYEPIRDLPRRCEGYSPRAGDPDRRTGRERWPGLI